MKVKIIFILIDGIGDVGVPKLNYKTPLEKTKHPYFDAIAETGILKYINE